MRVALRFLKFRDRLANIAGLKIQHAQFKLDGEVGRVFLDALLGLGELKTYFLRRDGRRFFRRAFVKRIQL